MARPRHTFGVLLLVTMVVGHSATAGATFPETGHPGASTSTAQLATTVVDVDPSDLPGNGTRTDPYVITNASELQAMADDLNASYRLGADVNASGTAQWNNGKGFDPIGHDPFNASTGPPFNGTFNGAGHTITGLAINRSTEDYVGLFGYVADRGVVHNISLHEVSITGSKSVGGLVGRNNGTVRDTSTGGNVTGSGYVGGLLGENSGTIRDVSASGDVNGSYTVGGLVGENDDGMIRNASASGTVNGSVGIGGLVGRNTGRIQDVWASGTVTGRKEPDTQYATTYTIVGGLVGFNNGTIRAVSASSNVTGFSLIGGLVGFNAGSIRDASTSGSVNGSYSVGGLIGFNRDGTIRAVSANGSVNGFRRVGGLIGFSDDPVLIRDASANATVTGSSDVGGLVGRNDGTIRDASASGAVNGSDNVGGLVGLNTGLVQDTFATGTVTGSEYVGGLVGDNEIPLKQGTVRESYWDTRATGQPTSAGNATGLTTAEMTGSAARTNMTGLNFGTFWHTRPEDYPAPIELSAASQQNGSVAIGGGSVTPALVNESETVTHDISVRVANLSADGNMDVISVTFPNAVAGVNTLTGAVNVTTPTDGSTVSVTAGIAQVDGPDIDGVAETLRFAVMPTGTRIVDVVVNVTVDVSWPAVTTPTSVEVRVSVVDSSTGILDPRTVGSVTIWNVTAETVTPGDVNDDGTIDTGDVIQIQRWIVGRSTASSFSAQAADVTGDGTIDTGDVIQIQRKIVGLSSVL